MSFAAEDKKPPVETKLPPTFKNDLGMSSSWSPRASRGWAAAR
jgi:hypothetical protein